MLNKTFWLAFWILSYLFILVVPYSSGMLTDKALQHAIQDGDLNLVKTLMEQQQQLHEDGIIDINERDANGLTLWSRAVCDSGHVPIVRYFVETWQANVHASTGDGGTPLECAIRDGNVDLIRYLIDECHVDVVHAFDRYQSGMTALHMACSCDQLIVVKFFVQERGMSVVHTINYAGETALHTASLGGNLDIVQYLVESCKGEDGDDAVSSFINVATTDYGWTALHHASRDDGNLAIVQYLVETTGGADLLQKDFADQTALDMARRKLCWEIAHYLQEKQVELNREKAKGAAAAAKKAKSRRG